MFIENWLMFVSIAFVATVTPGPAVFLVISNSVSYGLKNTVITILGNISGLLVMSGLSVLGLSAVLLHSVLLFSIIKFVGAAYLIYLGVKLWRHGFGRVDSGIGSVRKTKLPGLLNRYLQGLFISLSNPKAIAFTMALFPQFLDEAQPLLPQFSFLVLTFMSLSFGCLFSYGYVAENVKSRGRSSGFSAYISKIFGSAFIVSGIALAGVSQK